MTNKGSTYDAVFGYQNDNEDLVEIAVGSRNRFLPTPQGRGQTTDFLPGSHQEAFTVTGIRRAAQLAWAVTHAGATRAAIATSGLPGEVRCARAAVAADRHLRVPRRPRRHVRRRLRLRERQPGRQLRPDRARQLLPAEAGGIAASRRCSAPAGTRTRSAYAASRTPPRRRGRCPTEGRASRPSRRRPRAACDGSENPRRRRDRAPLRPPRRAGTYTAMFGYANLGRERRHRSRSARTNLVDPAPGDRGQPAVFVPASSRSRSRYGRCRRSGRHVDRRADAGEVDNGARLGRPGPRLQPGSIEGDADLDLTKVARPDSVDVGERIEYTITVHNAGTAPCSRRSRSTGRSTRRIQLPVGRRRSRALPRPGSGHIGPARASACSATSPPTNRPRSSSRLGRASPDVRRTARPS